MWTLTKMGEFCGEVMLMWKGIDVSDNQGTINWAQILEDVDFAVLRSVRRSGTADHQFATNLRDVGSTIYLCLYISIPTQLHRTQRDRKHSRSWNC